MLDPAVKAALLASTTIFCTTTIGDDLDKVASIRERLRTARMTQEGLAAEHRHIERIWSEVLAKHKKAIAALALTPLAVPGEDVLWPLAGEAVALGRAKCPTFKGSPDVVLEFWNGVFRGRLNRKPVGDLKAGPTPP